MIFHATSISGVYEIDLELMEDNRGGFARTFCKNEFLQIGFEKSFVQMNHSFNDSKGTLRGLHFQHSPHQETKLIRCIKGGIIDVIVDVRKKSSTFLHHIKVELSALNKKMILIPEGCAHGFQTLEDNTELIYHHTEMYAPHADGGLNYQDPKLDIQWNLAVNVISEKDNNYKFIDKKFEGI